MIVEFFLLSSIEGRELEGVQKVKDALEKKSASPQTLYCLANLSAALCRYQEAVVVSSHLLDIAADNMLGKQSQSIFNVEAWCPKLKNAKASATSDRDWKLIFVAKL